jgi:sugar porter (SP) family MFS transporter
VLGALRERLTNTRTIFALGALGAVLFGYDNGIISGAILFIPNDIPLSSGVEGFVVSSAVLGAMVGAIASGPVADRIGRQRLLLAAGVVFTLGAIGAGTAADVAALVVSRAVLGLGIGISSVAVPLYLAEMAPAGLRGVVTSLNQYMIIIGTGLAGGVGWALSFSGSWRWMLVIGVFPAVVLLVGVAFMPDTPRSLVRRGHPEQARRTLLVLRPNPDDAEAEFRDITHVSEEESSSAPPRELFRSIWVRRLLVIGVLLAVFQQITGINAVVYYSPSVLTEVGLSQSNSLLFLFLNGMLNIVTIAIVVRLHVVDRWGRKPILLAGLIGMAASLAAIGITNLTTSSGSDARVVVTIAAFVVFTNVFSATWGPVLWVVLAEIYPLRIRGTALAIATLFNWGADFFVSQTFPNFQSIGGPGPVLLIYAAIGLLVFPIVLRFMPETKGRSLEELERDFRGSDRRELAYSTE